MLIFDSKIGCYYKEVEIQTEIAIKENDRYGIEIETQIYNNN